MLANPPDPLTRPGGHVREDGVRHGDPQPNYTSERVRAAARHPPFRRPVGLAVLKIYWNGEKKTGHLVELVISKEKTDQVREALLAHVFATFRWQKVDLISLWMSPANPHLPCLTKMGFEGGDWHTNFGYLPLNPALSDGLSQTANWHLSMADSDAF